MKQSVPFLFPDIRKHTGGFLTVFLHFSKAIDLECGNVVTDPYPCTICGRVAVNRDHLKDLILIFSPNLLPRLISL